MRFTDLQTDYIPETIKINDRYITVILPGEENINRCNYCKSKNHCIEQCVIKPGNKIPKTYANVSKTNSNITKDPKPVASRSSLSPSRDKSPTTQKSKKKITPKKKKGKSSKVTYCHK